MDTLVESVAKSGSISSNSLHKLTMSTGHYTCKIVEEVVAVASPTRSSRQIGFCLAFSLRSIGARTHTDIQEQRHHRHLAVQGVRVRAEHVHDPVEEFTEATSLVGTEFC